MEYLSVRELLKPIHSDDHWFDIVYIVNGISHAVNFLSMALYLRKPVVVLHNILDQLKGGLEN